MLLELGRANFQANVYHEFETAFLSTTLEFYQQDSLSFLSNNTASDYVVKAASRLEAEARRAKSLQLPVTTEGPLLTTVETEWIQRHSRVLVDMEPSGFSAMLQDDTKVQSLRDMYDLFVRVPSSVDHLREALAARIKQDGVALVQDQEKGASDPSAFCRGVLVMKA